MDSLLRPRDIQARIRSGESPDAVAAAAGTTVDRIMGFAAPVLAERAYVAQQALKASVRRRAGDGPIGHLGVAVAERMVANDVDPESVAWDAWRRDDGRWVLVADYEAAGADRQARFVFDAAGRYVMADDEESRRLVGERVPGQPDPSAAAARPQLALGDDAIEVVTGLRPAVEPSHPALADREDTEPVEVSEWMLTQASERPAADAPSVPAPAPAPVEALFDTTHLSGSPEEPSPAVDAAPDAQPSAPPRKSGRSRGRASVPSWDEIMFGSGQGE